MHMTLTHDNEGIPTFNVKNRIKVSGEVTITNGDTVIKGHNTILKAFVLSLANWFSAHTMSNDSIPCKNIGIATYVYILLGTDTTTPTTVTTSSLTSPIATIPTFISSYAWSQGVVPYLQFTATWNPETISGTIGEMSLHIASDSAGLNAALSTYSTDSRSAICRYAVADGEFTQFTIDTSKPVTVAWVLKFEGDGIFTNQMICEFANYTSCYDEANYNCPCYGWTSKTTYMVIGSDTTTPNDPTMTALVAPIGTAPGTRATTQTCSTTQVSDGHYKLTLTATWNSGTVSGTLGEVGLWLYTYPGYLGVSGSYQAGGPYLCARMSNADEHFTSFTIDNTKNLVIDWEIFFDFD